MMPNIRSRLALASAGLLLLLSGAAQAVIVDINALTNGGPNNVENDPVTIAGLSPSDTIDITQIGQASGGAYDAWNAWGTVSGCDAAGANCSTGWANKWAYFVNGDFSTRVQIFDNVIYSTALLALANAVPVGPITGVTSISFYISDIPYTDNLGGI
jgi:hypothetical protein